MASKTTIFHKRNGIALLVLIVAALTVVILVMLKPTKEMEYIIYSVIICVLWLIPSTMYYVLIVHYKKTINSDVIPKIVVSLTKTLQSMYDCSKYTPQQVEMIGQVAGETVVKSVLSKSADTKSDIAEVIDSVRVPSADIVAEHDLTDLYGVPKQAVQPAPVVIRQPVQDIYPASDLYENKTIVLPQVRPRFDMSELERRSRLMAEHNVGFVDTFMTNQPKLAKPSDFSLSIAEAARRRDARARADARREEDIM